MIHILGSGVQIVKFDFLTRLRVLATILPRELNFWTTLARLDQLRIEVPNRPQSM